MLHPSHIWNPFLLILGHKILLMTRLQFKSNHIKAAHEQPQGLSSRCCKPISSTRTHLVLPNVRPDKNSHWLQHMLLSEPPITLHLLLRLEVVLTRASAPPFKPGRLPPTSLLRNRHACRLIPTFQETSNLWFLLFRGRNLNRWRSNLTRAAAFTISCIHQLVQMSITY